MPLTLPLLALAIGGILGSLAFSGDPWSTPKRRKRHLPVLFGVSAVAAIVPNAGQWLYDAGLSTLHFEILEQVSYLTFAFAAVGAWVLLSPSRTRWLLLALVPVLLAQPVLWTYAFVAWATGGFAP